MSNSNFSNNPGQENYRGRANNERSNFRDRLGGRRDGGGFRIRLSDNEMKAVKSIQETFCLLYTSPSPRDYAASRMPSSA